MPICFAEVDSEVVIKDIKGTDKIKTHLHNLGFMVGETVQIINKVDENIILKVKGVTLAISTELARRIII